MHISSFAMKIWYGTNHDYKDKADVWSVDKMIKVIIIIVIIIIIIIIVSMHSMIGYKPLYFMFLKYQYWSSLLRSHNNGCSENMTAYNSVGHPEQARTSLCQQVIAYSSLNL